MRAGVFQRLWWTFWFYGGAQPTLTILFKDNLFLFSATNVIVTVMFAALVYFLILPYRQILFRPLSGFEILVVLLNLVNLISIVDSPVMSDNPLRLYGFLLSTMALSFTVVFLVRAVEDVSALVTSMARAFILGAMVTALAPLLLMDLTAVFSSRYGLQELIHPNSIGFRAAVAFMFLVGGIKVSRHHVVNGFLEVFFILTLLLTFSKTSLIAVTLAVALWWGMSHVTEHPVRKWFLLTAAAVPVGVLWERLIAQLLVYLENPDLYATLTGRLPLWRLVVDLSAERPWFGFGFSTFREVIRPHTEMWWLVEIVHAHNAYLTALLQTGVVGTLLLVMMALSLMRRALRLFKYRENGYCRLWIIVVFVILARSITEGSFGTGGFELAIVIAWGLVGRKLDPPPIRSRTVL